MTFEKLRAIQRTLLALLIPALLVSEFATAPLRAQVESIPSLRIVVLSGDAAMNSIRRPAPQELVVRVENESQRPLPGVSVTFQAPAQGPSARFRDDSAIAMVTTDLKGEARATLARPNEVQGEFQ